MGESYLVHFDLKLDHGLLRLLQLRHHDPEVGEVLLEMRILHLDKQGERLVQQFKMGICGPQQQEWRLKGAMPPNRGLKNIALEG